MIGAGLRRQALLLLVLLVTALGGTAATSRAADDDPRSGSIACFGLAPTKWGTSGPDTIYGTKGNDVIVGFEGDDTILGKGGDDLICGNEGTDIIWGQGGDDLIDGNEGSDLLFGGSGRDRLQGGPGSDILYGEDGGDTLLGGPGSNILNGGLRTDRCLSGDTYVSCELPSVDKILAECPTKREIARIDAEFDLSFEGDPTPTWFICSASQGSAYLTPLQKRAYNALLIMGRISFDAALPWDSGYTLEDWFALKVDTIRFRDDIAYSQYGPAGVINIQTGWPLPTSQRTDLWMNPEWNTGLAHLMILMVHEARHADLLHNCGWDPSIPAFTKDENIAYLGAWGVQYYLELWLAEHTSQAFLRPLAGDPGYYQYRHNADAAGIKNACFCNEP